VRLIDKMQAIHASLQVAGLPHAFGGALALAWCVDEPRATRDIDVNVFISTAHAEVLRDALPNEVTLSAANMATLEQDGQARLWWHETPVDVFLNSIPFHERVAQRSRWELFGNERLPFLGCLDIAVFKSFFNRAKDWADLQEMQAAGTLDGAMVREILVEHLGEEDERLRMLDNLVRTGRAFKP